VKLKRVTQKEVKKKKLIQYKLWMPKSYYTI
jgi:hypothetical protein